MKITIVGFDKYSYKEFNYPQMKDLLDYVRESDNHLIRLSMETNQDTVVYYDISYFNLKFYCSVSARVSYSNEYLDKSFSETKKSRISLKDLTQLFQFFINQS